MSSRRLYLKCEIYWIAAILLFSLLETGCILFPTKLPTRIDGAAGAQLKKGDVDSKFIEVGVTRRDEVAAKLAGIDVGSPTQFFWGRWAESTWGVLGGAITGSGTEPVINGSTRHWHFRNLLVKFDEHGIAQQKLMIDDGETLWQQLLAYSRSLPTASASEEMRIPSTDRKYNEILLSAESIQFSGAKQESNMILRLPSPAVIHLRPHFQKQLDPCYTLEVDSAGAAVKRKATFCASGQQLAQIVAFLDRLPAPARWEGK